MPPEDCMLRRKRPGGFAGRVCDFKATSGRLRNLPSGSLLDADGRHSVVCSMSTWLVPGHFWNYRM